MTYCYLIVERFLSVFHYNAPCYLNNNSGCHPKSRITARLSAFGQFPFLYGTVVEVAVSVGVSVAVDVEVAVDVTVAVAVAVGLAVAVRVGGGVPWRTMRGANHKAWSLPLVPFADTVR